MSNLKLPFREKKKLTFATHSHSNIKFILKLFFFLSQTAIISTFKKWLNQSFFSLKKFPFQQNPFLSTLLFFLLQFFEIRLGKERDLLVRNFRNIATWESGDFEGLLFLAVLSLICWEMCWGARWHWVKTFAYE